MSNPFRYFNVLARGHPSGRDDVCAIPAVAAQRRGSGAARLAAIPAGESPANTGSPVHVVVISSGRAGDQSAGSLEVKALWGRETGSIRQRGASNLACRNVSKPGSLERRAPREADCGNFGSAEPLT